MTLPTVLRRWSLEAPVRGVHRVPHSVLRWCEQLKLAITDALPLGAPVGALLRAVQPMVRREERHFEKLRAVEKQFAFQGALAVVLPWGVAAATGDISLNAFTVAGAAVQALGLVLFYVVIRRALRPPSVEQAWVFDLLVATWMRVLAGIGLRHALGAAVTALPASHCRQQWQRWLEAYDSGALASSRFEWAGAVGDSREISGVLTHMLQAGTPAGETLSDLIAQIDDEHQARIDEKLSGLPTRLSLVFCGLLAPAVFLVFMGGLWPTLREISL